MGVRAFLEAAAGFPTLLFTAALVVVVGFWVLVAFSAAGSDSFDADADLGVWGMGGVPVAVALTLLTVLTWVLGVGSAILLDVFVPSGLLAGLLRLVAPIVGLLAAWRLTRLFVRALHSLSPDEPELLRPAEARSGTTRADDAADKPRGAPFAIALDARDRAAVHCPRDRAA
ncbi:hypothetical protein OHA74_54120 [Streptomyces phaeochromogenes]|uniref:hypothetical protein n=1 Tax=Streptomyces phaeochromogenes TaxID=1923 RepID=UPI002E2B594B|nr:hypothetical protein [Streptomyces phaeochromogenes]